MSSTPQNSSVEEAATAAAAGGVKEKLQVDPPAAAAATIAKMPSSRTPPVNPLMDEEIFSQALQELKDLRSQLHYAARYCESAFLENQDKRRMVLESTKRYVCVAIVAVVDHLGNLSSKLEETILDDGEVVETEHKMDCLKQRLMTCQQYAVSIQVFSLQLSRKFPSHHHYYAYPCPWMPVDGKPTELSRNETSDLDESESPEMIGQFVLAVHLPVDTDDTCVVPNDSPTKSADTGLVDGVPILCYTEFDSKYEDNYLVAIGEKKKEKKKKTKKANRFLSFLRVNRLRI